MEDSPCTYLRRPGGSPPLTDKIYSLKDVRLLAPCLPSKIVAVGLNCRKHAQERNVPIPDHSLFFLKPSTSVIGTEGKIVYPSSVITLLPGDMISTGTPSGTRTPEGPGTMKPGDVVEVRIEGTDTLRNHIVEEK